MKTIQPNAFGAILSISILVVLQHPVRTAPARLHKACPSRAATAKSALPYSLSLSLPSNTSPESHCVPLITPTLTNLTSYMLALRWTEPDQVAFEVDYKVPTSDPNHDADWKRLMPNARPIPDENSQANSPQVIVTSGSAIRLHIRAGSQYGIPSIVPDFPMSELGFYRITATLTVPQASEYNGPIIPATKIRSFELVVHSKPFIIQRTAEGFVPVSEGTPKPARTK